MGKVYSCGLKGCSNDLRGGARVGFETSEGKLDEVVVCGKHAFQIMAAPRGTFRISDDRRLTFIPQKKTIL